MENLILTTCSVVAIVSGAIMLLKPRWFRNLWKIKTTYDYWGEKAASLYYTVLGVASIVFGLWLLIKYFLPLIRL